MKQIPAPVNPTMLNWAIARSRKDIDELAKKRELRNLEAWLKEEKTPTVSQLMALAEATHTTFGRFLQPEPPSDELPILDFRIKDITSDPPSADLIDTIYAMQRRQAWLSEERNKRCGWDEFDFVGSATLQDDIPIEIGQKMRSTLKLADGWASEAKTWQHAINYLRDHLEQQGIMVVINGVVGNNTSRKLDVNEFRGFALSDKYAPLIFVNGADVKAAQMFTLAHELAHLWLGSKGEGMSGDVVMLDNQDSQVEMFCNKAAAEFLVPAQELQERWSDGEISHIEEDLARDFKVSPIVIMWRAMDIRLISRDYFNAFYEVYIREERAKKPAKGDNFYNTQNARLGKEFAAAVFCAAAEMRLSYKEAQRLTDLRGNAFTEYARKLGIYM